MGVEKERGGKMFKPKAKTRKLLEKARAAYVYKDGIVVWEERSARSGKLTTRMNVYHVFPCGTYIQSYDYGNGTWGSGPLHGTAKSVGFHDPKLLLSGLERVSVAYNSKSEAMEKRGLNCTSVSLHTANGMEIRLNVWPFLSCQVWISPDPLNDRLANSDPIDSYEGFVERCVEHDDHVEIHEEW
jgi:hypothetical protein